VAWADDVPLSRLVWVPNDRNEEFRTLCFHPLTLSQDPECREGSISTISFTFNEACWSTPYNLNLWNNGVLHQLSVDPTTKKVNAYGEGNLWDTPMSSTLMDFGVPCLIGSICFSDSDGHRHCLAYQDGSWTVQRNRFGLNLNFNCMSKYYQHTYDAHYKPIHRLRWSGLFRWRLFQRRTIGISARILPF